MLRSIIIKCRMRNFPPIKIWLIAYFFAYKCLLVIKLFIWSMMYNQQTITKKESVGLEEDLIAK